MTRRRWYEIAIALWPLALVFVGGAVGLACGGAAAAVNVRLMRVRRRPSVHAFVCCVVGVVFAALGTAVSGIQ